MGEILVLLDSQARRRDRTMDRLAEHADFCASCAWAMGHPDRMDNLCALGDMIFGSMG